MDFFEVVEQRRSVRQFASERVPEEVIDRALDAALQAPNSSNLQLWEFYWIRGAHPKKELVKACFSQGAAQSADQLVVVVARPDLWRRNLLLLKEALRRQFPSWPKFLAKYYDKVVPMMYSHGFCDLWGLSKKTFFSSVGWLRPVPRGPFSARGVQEVAVKSTALACENFMLAVTAQGYASCPMEGFDEKRVKKILQLPRASCVVMVLGVGKAKEENQGTRVRLSRDLFVMTVGSDESAGTP